MCVWTTQFVLFISLVSTHSEEEKKTMGWLESHQDVPIRNTNLFRHHVLILFTVVFSLLISLIVIKIVYKVIQNVCKTIFLGYTKQQQLQLCGNGTICF